jgi:hypothetical protein
MIPVGWSVGHMRIFAVILLAAVTASQTVELSAQTGTSALRRDHSVEVERIDVVPVQGVPWHGRLISAIGGAALGAGIGFFASQVFRGDWDEEPGRNQVDRPAWAAVGGSIGLAFGLSFPLGGRGLRPDPERVPRNGRRSVTTEELSRQGIRTAHDAVRLLRPEWLRPRGVHIIGESAEQAITVYLDDLRLGGTLTLRDISVETVEVIHFIDAAAATLRWGAGHSHGVIQVIARGGISRDGSL